MKALLLLLAIAAVCLSSSRAAIPVGAGGSGIIRFDTRPPASEWATKFISGLDVSFASAAELNAAVQTNATAASINTQLLDAGAANPPNQNPLASWSSGSSSNLWTRPTSAGATLLMATLQNNTGSDQSALQIIYALGQSGTAPLEQVPAHELYYSLSGDLGSWVNIPGLSGGAVGVKSNTVALSGTWTNGGKLYVLWADDNATAGVDRGYSLDDVSFAVANVSASAPRLTITRTDATHADITWPTNAGAFSLEGNLNLNGSNWITLGAAGQYPVVGSLYSTNVSIVSGLKIYRLRSVGTANTPVLSIVRTDATHADIFWPASATAYALQSNPDLNNTNAWNTIGSAGQYPLVGGVYRTNISITAGIKYFRLKIP